MKVFLGWLLIMTAWMGVASAEVTLESGPSRIFGLWTFAKSISSSGQKPSRVLLEVFSASAESKSKATQEVLHQFKTFYEKNFDAGYHFADYPRARNDMGWSIDGHFSYQAAQSRDLDEFKSRTTLLMPAAEHEILFLILSKLQPIYERLIWNPQSAATAIYTTKLIERWKKAGLSTLLDRAIKVYGSEWKGDIQFDLHIVPLPGMSGHSHATVLGKSILIEGFLNESKIPDQLGVLFHEICHSAHESQSASFQFQIETWFDKSPSAYAPFAKRLLSEGLATAFGNGLAYAAVTGEPDKTEWYSVKEIDQMAKAVVTSLKGRLESGKRIDKKFVDQWISIYQQEFPDAAYETTPRMRNIVLISDDQKYKVQELRDILEKNFRLDSTYSGSPIANKETLEMVDEAGPAYLLVAVVPKSRLSELNALTERMPELKPALEKFGASQKPSFVTHASLKQSFIIFQADSLREFSDLATKLKEMPLLSKTLTLVSMPLSPTTEKQKE